MADWKKITKWLATAATAVATIATTVNANIPEKKEEKK